MPRKLRLEFAGACYHVINRGNYRRDLFREDGARHSFEVTLFQAAERFRWWVHAYVIMRHHFHLAIETPEANIGEGMRCQQPSIDPILEASDWVNSVTSGSYSQSRPLVTTC